MSPVKRIPPYHVLLYHLHCKYCIVMAVSVPGWCPSSLGFLGLGCVRFATGTLRPSLALPSIIHGPGASPVFLYTPILFNLVTCTCRPIGSIGSSARSWRRPAPGVGSPTLQEPLPLIVSCTIFAHVYLLLFMHLVAHRARRFPVTSRLSSAMVQRRPSPPIASRASTSTRGLRSEAFDPRSHDASRTSCCTPRTARNVPMFFATIAARKHPGPGGRPAGPCFCRVPGFPYQSGRWLVLTRAHVGCGHRCTRVRWHTTGNFISQEKKEEITPPHLV